VSPAIKTEQEVNEDQEEVDIDAQPMGEYEEQYINEHGRDRILSGNEEDASEDDGHMRGRYPRLTSQGPDEDIDERRPEFVGGAFGMKQTPEDEVPRDDDGSDADSGRLDYLQQVDDDGEQSPLADNE
jgi:hypothetical protein